MASDLAKVLEGASVERQRLAQVLGRYGVSLSKLRPDELDDILNQMLSSLYIRHLRGFKPLRQAIALDLDEFTRCPMAEGVQLELVGSFEGSSFSLETQTQIVHRGVISREMVWHEYETGEETTDHTKLESWGPHDLVRGKRTYLVLKREGNSPDASNNLVLVTTHFEKTPRREEYFIKRVVAQALPISNFRRVLGDKACRVARDLIGGISDIFARSIREIRAEVERMTREQAEWDRIHEAIRE